MFPVGNFLRKKSYVSWDFIGKWEIFWSICSSDDKDGQLLSIWHKEYRPFVNLYYRQLKKAQEKKEIEKYILGWYPNMVPQEKSQVVTLIEQFLADVERKFG